MRLRGLLSLTGKTGKNSGVNNIYTLFAILLALLICLNYSLDWTAGSDLMTAIFTAPCRAEKENTNG